MPYVCTRCGRRFGGEKLARHLCVRRAPLLVCGAVAAAILAWLVR